MNRAWPSWMRRYGSPGRQVIHGTTSLCLKIDYAFPMRSSPDLEFRQAALEESIVLARKTGDPYLIRESLTGMGDVLAGVGQHEAATSWFEEALKVARTIESSTSIIDAIIHLGRSYLELGRLLEAKKLALEGFRMAVDSEARSWLGGLFGLMGNIALSEGGKVKAARLFGAGDILEYPVRVDPPSELPRALGMDEKTARAEWKIGRSMTPEQAIAYALSDD